MDSMLPRVCSEIGGFSKITGKSFNKGVRRKKYPNMVKLEQNPDYLARQFRRTEKAIISLANAS